MSEYTVLNTFIEKEHQGVTYEKGDKYPFPGFAPNKERVAFLQSDNNPYKKSFLGPEIGSVVGSETVTSDSVESEDPIEEQKKETVKKTRISKSKSDE